MNPSNYFYNLFQDKFMYCGIDLSTEGYKPDGKPKKNHSFLLDMTKSINP